MELILSAEMMLECLRFKSQSSVVSDAVRAAIENDCTPQDLGGSLGTAEVGDYIVKYIEDNVTGTLRGI